ncbi:MAG: hypothetical protein J6K04_08130 [Lachnospiraceae bacterium]|nr:hypothetical protein [Lachnospiraceae bacterium]MBP3569119.1 hypothetical protein [Lachnospiraceae bacterium]
MFKAFWEKVRPSLSVWLNANKTGCIAIGRGFAWFGKQCARFGRWCASLWKEHLQAPVLKALQLHWIPALLLVIVSAALLLYAFAWPDANPVIAYAGYFISAYTLAVVCFRMPKIIKGMKKVLYSHAYSEKFLTDKKLRTEFFLYFGCGFSIVYAIFKFTAGMYYRSVWIGAVAVYYIIVSLMRFGLIKRYRYNLQYEDEREQRLFGLKSYRFCGILMFVLNVAVTGLVIQLIWHGETYQYPGFLIYAFAAYSFYCIGMAVRNMAKHRKLDTPILAAAKMLSFACALMSILATQTAMLTQFGDGQEMFARIMNAVTGSVVCLLIFGLALWMVRRANKEMRKMGE